MPLKIKRDKKIERLFERVRKQPAYHAAGIEESIYAIKKHLVFIEAHAKELRKISGKKAGLKKGK